MRRNAARVDRDCAGRALLGRLRESPLTASVPVLALAPKFSDSVKDEDLELAADGIMEQPADEEEVVAWIKTRLRRARETVREARRDPTTGLLNRAAVRETYNDTLTACSSSQAPLALALVSIDNFRTLVESHGDAAAFEIVRRVGLLLSASLRVTDVIGRWDTALFAALFPGEDKFGGARAVQKVIEKTGNMRTALPEGTALEVTLSGGVTVVTDKKSVEEAFDEAESYLFQAVAAGGNRVVSSPSDAPRMLKRILLVSGDDRTARIVSHLLEREGFAVTTVPGGARAMEEVSAEQTLCHLIVVDEATRDPAGFDVLESLRNMPRLNRTPILMLLERNAEEGMVRALELGANDYLGRPFAPLTLMTHVRRLLTRRTLAEGAGADMPCVLVVGTVAKDLLMIATALRERGGFRTCLGLGMQDGLNRFRELRPDILILETDAKDMDCVAFLQRAASGKVSRLQMVNVIAFGESEEPSVRSALTAQGVRGILPRPLDPMSLAQDVERVLGIPENLHRTMDSAEHLNTEIRRVMRLAVEKVQEKAK
jgi:diguanylate cyclase (GGDEF)-like protein